MGTMGRKCMLCDDGIVLPTAAPNIYNINLSWSASRARLIIGGIALSARPARSQTLLKDAPLEPFQVNKGSRVDPLRLEMLCSGLRARLAHCCSCSLHSRDHMLTQVRFLLLPSQ